MRLFLPGGAGLVGLNLIQQLHEKHPDWDLVVVDKKRAAVEVGRRLYPWVTFLVEDLCETEAMRWPAELQTCEACVMLQAEIGNTDASQFERNNIEATRVVLAQLSTSGVRRLVHISSYQSSVSDPRIGALHPSTSLCSGFL